MTVSINNISENTLKIEDAGRYRQRKSIWAFYPPLKCPVAGICLTLAEHKRILKKSDFVVKGRSHYQLHQAIMSHLNDENQVSKKTDRFLNHKYRNDITELNELNENALIKEWRNRFDSGCIEGVFWVVAGRPDLSDKALAEIYGDIHMSGHTSISKIMRIKQEMYRQTQALNKTARTLKIEKQRVQKLKQETSRLKRDLQIAKIKVERQKTLFGQKLQTFLPTDAVQLEKENRCLRKKNEVLENENNYLIKRNRILDKEKRYLQIEFTDTQAANQRLADEAEWLITQIGSIFECSSQCNENCARFQLCERRILLVGGITKMKHLYRDLIESCGGKFEYHDGYVKAGVQKLKAQVGRSDLVLCPVNCNSHGACKKVKSLCKKMNKTVKMLPQSSLSIISDALIQSSTQPHQ